MPRHAILTAALWALAMAAPAQAQPASPSAVQPAQASPAADLRSDGEVRKIDREQGKLTLRHGPIVHLDMPAMTMVFRAATPALLDPVKEGDKVKFVAEKVNGVFTVQAIEVVR